MEENTENKIEISTLELYREYGITEWEEKKVVLTEVEIKSILKDLKEGKETPLVILSKLPFPKFIEVYLNRFDSWKTELEKDPTLPFKLYMLPRHCLKAYVQNIRLKECLIKEEEFDSRSYKEAEGTLSNSFELLSKPYTGSKDNIRGLLKFIYLTQYIDLETAKKLNLSIAQYMERNNIDGFGFEEKMKCLNTATRELIVKLLGLYGNQKTTKTVASEETGIPSGVANKILDILLPLFTKTLGEFKHGIKIMDREYRIDEAREYLNPTFRDLDLKAQIAFIRKYVLTEEEKQILSTLPNETANIYIAYKHIYDTEEQVSRNLVVNPFSIREFSKKGN